MRDADRIPIVLNVVESIWLKHPDLRLGQLLLNILTWEEDDSYMYYMEDDELVRKLEDFYETPLR